MFEQTVAGSRTRTCLGASPDIHQVSPDHDNTCFTIPIVTNNIVLHLGQLLVPLS